ncbi:MAG: hypothetical protein ACRDWE_09325, partial [Acidimicrobiales bacterium]
DRLIVSMTRARVSPYSTARTDPQTTLSRAFTLPTARTFTLSGTATLSAFLSGIQLARLTGNGATGNGATGTGVVASSSSRLTGDLAGSAGAAADGNPRTMWQSGFGGKDVQGAWLQYVMHSPVTVDHLTLAVVADREHSVPAQVEITARTATGSTATRTVTLLPITRSVVPGTIVHVPVSFAAVSGRRIRISFPEVRFRHGTEGDGTPTAVLPLGIATVGIPGVSVPSAPAALPGHCQSNLVTIDGSPVTVKVVGRSARALADGEVALEPCGRDATGIRLSAGHHVVETALATTRAHDGTDCASSGGCDGWNVDELTLSSAPGGSPAHIGHATLRATPSSTRSLAPPVPGKVPAVVTTSTSATAKNLSVHGATAPFELVLGESVNPGWHAVAHPAAHAPAGSHEVALGPSELVDGFANGWAVTPADLHALGATGAHGGSDFTVTVAWTPQREVWIGIGVSAVATAVCLVLAFVSEERRRRWRARRARGGRGGRGVEHTRAHAADPIPVPEPAGARELDDRPTLSLPVGVRAQRLPWIAIVLVSVVTGALAAAISQPLCGVGVAAAVAAGLCIRHLRLLGAAAAVALLVAAGAIVVVGQVLHPAPSGATWPSGYTDAADLAAMAVAFLGADAVVDYCRRVAGRSSA